MILSTKRGYALGIDVLSGKHEADWLIVEDRAGSSMSW